jgi:hypothetical protein
MPFFSVPASITQSIEAATTAATDLLSVGSQACDICGALGATVGGDAIALAKETEKKIQETIPKISGNVSALKNSLTADIMPLLNQAEKMFDGYFAGGGFQGMPALPGVPSIPGLQNLPGGFPSVPGLPNIDGLIPQLPSLPPVLANFQSSLTASMSSFGATAAGITSQIAAKVGDLEASVAALIPPLTAAVQTVSAGSCKGIQNQLQSVGDNLVPAFDAIKTQIETKTIPSLEPQVTGLLDAAKNMAESAATQFAANQGAIESAANAMKNNMLSQFSALGINI